MRAAAYYNEIDPYCAQWLRNLMDAGHIPVGDIDTRSIEDVRPDDLRGYVQCHFFAGLGGWAYALALAGWPAGESVWTGSCPCQPFSAAGKGAGFADERHLWPAWQHLIAQCRPPVVFGEQVASKNAEPWIDLVHADMEGMGYAFGCVPFPSAGVGAPHIRDRAFWLAHAGSEGLPEQHGRWTEPARLAATDGAASRLANPDGRHPSAEREQRSGEQRQQPEDGRIVRLAQPHGELTRSDAKALHEGQSEFGGRGGNECAGPTNGFWRAADWLGCTDGKWRPVEPGTFPLAHGIPGRVGRLRAYGNAINAQAAAEFIRAYCEARGPIALDRPQGRLIA